MSVDRGRRGLLIASLSAAVASTSWSRSKAEETGAVSRAGLSKPTPVISLWPGQAPGIPPESPVETVVERSDDPARPDRALTGIVQPRMEVFRPDVPNGCAVLVFPGGGYQRVVIDKEGYELGNWLAERGYTVFVLYYRLPGDGWAAGPDVSLSDAQRALRLVRHRCLEFGIEPQRIATLGFSAGGHLCADLATRFQAETYAPVDDADGLSARPSFAALVYPVISMSAPLAHPGSRERLIGKDANADLERKHSPQFNVSARTPPSFMVHAEDDQSVPVGNTLAFRAALKTHGIAVETHLFDTGGHGFGLRKIAGKPVAIWPELLVSWIQSTVAQDR